MKSVDCVLDCAHWSLKLIKFVQITARSLDLFFCVNSISTSVRSCRKCHSLHSRLRRWRLAVAVAVFGLPWELRFPTSTSYLLLDSGPWCRSPRNRTSCRTESISCSPDSSWSENCRRNFAELYFAQVTNRPSGQSFRTCVWCDARVEIPPPPHTHTHTPHQIHLGGREGWWLTRNSATVEEMRIQQTLQHCWPWMSQQCHFSTAIAWSGSEIWCTKGGVPHKTYGVLALAFCTCVDKFFDATVSVLTETTFAKTHKNWRQNKETRDIHSTSILPDCFDTNTLITIV